VQALEAAADASDVKPAMTLAILKALQPWYSPLQPWFKRFVFTYTNMVTPS
jgi:hypothetical protein